jgi:glycosyltransferase involved in cell wall biosynthesis
MSLGIVIGILAYNEESCIVDTLTSLKSQSIFSLAENHYTVVVIPNGCTDNTVKICKEYFAGWHHELADKKHIRLEVVELKFGDKANAWNVLIHDLCPKGNDFVFLLDADIKIDQVNNLEKLIGMLVDNSEVDVATSLPIKVLPKGTSWWFAKLSMAGSSNQNHSRHSICGQLYVSRQSVLNKIWLPTGLPVEDGFIRAMVLTRAFSENEVIKRIDRCDGASHGYEGERSLSGLLRHQIRGVAGSVLNLILYRYLESLNDHCGDACLIMRQNMIEHPNLLKELVEKHNAASGWFVIPVYFFFWRLDRLKYYRGMERLSKLPILFLGVVFDISAAIGARQLFKHKSVIGFW